MGYYEDGCIVLEDVDESEYNLWLKTFSNELCGWITYEIYKKLGDTVEHKAIFPGTGICLLNPKTINYPCSVYLSPVSEDKVSIYYLGMERDNKIILSPEDAVKFILEL